MGFYNLPHNDLLTLTPHVFFSTHSIGLIFLCSLREMGVSFETMFEEIPVVIRNSHLMNVTLCEIEDKLNTNRTYNNLDMATG